MVCSVVVLPTNHFSPQLSCGRTSECTELPAARSRWFTHTHTHTNRERDMGREKEGERHIVFQTSTSHLAVIDGISTQQQQHLRLDVRGAKITNKITFCHLALDSVKRSKPLAPRAKNNLLCTIMAHFQATLRNTF